MTSASFVAAARHFGIDRETAIASYQSFYREGSDPRHAVITPIARIHDDVDTTKFITLRDDGLEVETVVLRNTGRTAVTRRTLCVSSQIGCAMGCTFCETARMGLMTSLSTEAIVAQWAQARWSLGVHIDNVVFMGMGEPLDNLDAVCEAIEVLTDHHGPALAPSRITVSTVGLATGIDTLRSFCDRDGYRRVKLAVSVNAPDDDVRREIMPIARAVPMSELLAAMARWTNGTRRRVLVEYVVIPGVNDAPSHARALCRQLADHSIACTINVIPYNPRRESPWPAPGDDVVDRFVKAIQACGQMVRRRRTLGRDLMAACGQLGNARVRRRRIVEESSVRRPLSVHGVVQPDNG